MQIFPYLELSQEVDAEFDGVEGSGLKYYLFVFLQSRLYPWFNRYRVKLIMIIFILLKRKQKPTEVMSLSPGHPKDRQWGHYRTWTR